MIKVIGSSYTKIHGFFAKGPTCVCVYIYVTHTFVRQINMNMKMCWYLNCKSIPGIILGMDPANEGRRYNVMSLVDWGHILNEPYIFK